MDAVRRRHMRATAEPETRIEEGDVVLGPEEAP